MPRSRIRYRGLPENLRTTSLKLTAGQIEYLDKIADEMGVTRSDAIRHVVGKYVAERDFALVYSKDGVVSWHPPPKPSDNLLSKIGMAGAKFEGVIPLKEKYGLTTSDLTRLISCGFFEPRYLLDLIEKNRAEEQNVQ
jgi:hypothetical protein